MDHSQLQHVVVAFDYSLHAQAAVDCATNLAIRAPSHVLHFVIALDPRVGVAGYPPKKDVDFEYAEEVQTDLAEKIGAVFDQRDAAGEVHFFIHARIGSPTDEILNLAQEVGADLIIIGSHGSTGVERLLLGSVSERVVREAHCPVIVARPKTYLDVDLQHVIEVPHQPSHYTPPHRYSYTSNRVATRPLDWPLCLGNHFILAT